MVVLSSTNAKGLNMNTYSVGYIKVVFLVAEKASSGTLGLHLTAEVHSRCENHCQYGAITKYNYLF